MQYLENSAIGVRAALYTLVRNTGAPQILIFPMVHIGSADYYSQLRKKLGECDVILFEGVRGLRTRILTLSYRIVAKRARLGLVVQAKSLLLGLPARLVHTDVTAAEFEENWSQIPWRFRLAIVFIAPLYGTYLYFTASRESIGKNLKREDIPSSDDEARADLVPELEEAILGNRDAKLVAALESLLTGKVPNTVGIVYGAAHMKAVTNLLMGKYRYRVGQSEWLTVFDYAH
jgi:hypothetical protein